MFADEQIARASKMEPGSSRGGFVVRDVSHLIPDQGILHAYLHKVLSARVKAYSSCTASLEWVRLDAVTPLPRFANRERLIQARTFLARLREAETPPFGTVAYRRPEETYFRLALPPIIERRGGSLTLIDGLHRMLAAHEANYTQVQALVVSGIDLPLPSAPGNWSSVRTWNVGTFDMLPDSIHQLLSRRVKFRHYQKEFFRPLGGFLGGNEFWFDSLPQLTKHVYDVVRTDPSELLRHFRLQPKELDGGRVAPGAN